MALKDRRVVKLARAVHRRYGDRYCDDCTWVFPRELLDEERDSGDTCPCHGPSSEVKEPG